MKKKGLIIATIVMVLVLAVSLTTATYAWFTLSDVTTIKAFNVEVVPNNAVNIGLLADYDNVAYDEDTINADNFVYGDVVYAPGTAGVLGGTWTGSTGLGAKLNHNIEWGQQKKAVGLTTATTAGAALPSNTTEIVDDADFANKLLVAANGDTTTLSNQELAVANYNAANTEFAGASDYVHMVLGVQATKALQKNELILLLDGNESDGSIVGILAAVHVAYRVNGGDWVDEEFFSCDYKAALAEQTLTLETYQKDAYDTSYEAEGLTAPTSKAGKVVIDLAGLAVAQDQIAQVEIIIYIAGSDSDCNNMALNASGAISIFFATVDAPAQQG